MMLKQKKSTYVLVLFSYLRIVRAFVGYFYRKKNIKTHQILSVDNSWIGCWQVDRCRRTAHLCCFNTIIQFNVNIKKTMVELNTSVCLNCLIGCRGYKSFSGDWPRGHQLPLIIIRAVVVRRLILYLHLQGLKCNLSVNNNDLSSQVNITIKYTPINSNIH